MASDLPGFSRLLLTDQGQLASKRRHGVQVQLKGLGAVFPCSDLVKMWGVRFQIAGEALVFVSLRLTAKLRSADRRIHVRDNGRFP